MSAFKKIAGLVAGISAVGAIGVAVAQGVPPNPYITNPALGAGEQTVHMTPIGETGVLAWADTVQQTATLTRQDEQAAVAAAPAQDNSQPVASADTTTSSDTSSQQVAQAPSSDNNTQAMGAGPAPSDDNTSAPKAPRHDRG
jgi:cytoskeletal protein RodZ